MTLQRETNQDINRMFQSLQSSFNNMPVDARTKKSWLALVQREHALSLMILGNSALREQPVKNFEKLASDSSLKVVRETQSYSTLLDNMITFNQNQGGDFFKFIELDRVPANSGIMDLFSAVSSEPVLDLSAEIDWQPSKDALYLGSPLNNLYSCLHDAFVLFKELYSKQGYRKFSPLHLYYAGLQFGVPNLLNLPYVFLTALETLQQLERRKNLGRRQVTPVSLNQIEFDLIVKHFQEHLVQMTDRVQAWYKKTIGFHKLNVRSKVCINYALNNGFEMPPSLQVKGFTYENTLIKKLFTQGHLTDQDIEKKDYSLIAEIIEEDHMIIKSGVSGIAYYLNVSGSHANTLSSFNKMPQELGLKRNFKVYSVHEMDQKSEAAEAVTPALSPRLAVL